MNGESGFGWCRIHADFPPGASAFELHDTGHPREQRVISAKIDIESGENLRAALANDDAAGLDGLAAVGLDAQVLRIAIPTVARGAAALVCCHGESFSAC